MRARAYLFGLVDAWPVLREQSLVYFGNLERQRGWAWTRRAKALLVRGGHYLYITRQIPTMMMVVIRAFLRSPRPSASFLL